MWTENLDGLHQAKAAVLTAGLAASSYVGVDATGARHQGHKGSCTALGNDLFAYLESTDSKSRRHFLQVLRGSSSGSALHAVAVAYWQRQEGARAVVEPWCAGPRHCVAAAAGLARLAERGIPSERQVRSATAGALLGQLLEQGGAADWVLRSAGAPPCDILVHASCWVHAERPLARALPYHEAHRAALEQVRQQLGER